MEKTKLLIRTEGHVKMGMGNIYRDIRLAKKIQELYNPEIRFVIEPISVIGIKKILDAGFKVDLIDYNNNFNQYIKYIKKMKPDIVINDILNLEEYYMKELIKLNLLTVNFEDKEISTTREYADIVFNSIYEDKNTYVNYYYGPTYAPIRDSFKNIKDKRINKECKTFLLAFGGSDPSGFTLKVSKILDKIPDINATIFIGPSFSSHQQFYDLLRDLDKDKFTIRYDVAYNPEDFKDVDIAIASGGNTSYELAAAGIPTILLSQNQLEEERTPIFEKYGALINAGNGNKLSDGELIKNIKKLMGDYKLREKMSKNGMKTVDGYGLDRIVKIIFDGLEAKKKSLNK